MATTPLIKKITNRNGIFYAFQSGVRDSDMANSSNAYRFSFSKYALLNIPNFRVPMDNENFEEVLKLSEEDENFYKRIPNTVQFQAVGEDVIGNGDTTSSDKEPQSKYLAESFQNYCLNMEAVLLSQDEYNYNNDRRTVAERVFFKWLKELGAIRYEEADSNYYTKDVNDDDTTHYIEERKVQLSEDDQNDISAYNSVVKYINDIQTVYPNVTDIVTTELYIYVPTEQGASPYVLFTPVSDENYHYYTTEYANRYNTYTNPYLTTTDDSKYLCGRSDNNHPTGLVDVPYFDVNTKDDVVTKVVWSSDGSTTEWYGDATGNGYVTDSASSDESGNVSGNFFKNNIQIYTKTCGNRTVNYVRPTLDGITIDFNPMNYTTLVENEDEKDKKSLTLNDLNSFTQDGRDFEFNAILIYYDMINLLEYDRDSDGNIIDNKKVTNLYGVYFLNDIEHKQDEYQSNYIERDIKYAPNAANEDSSTNGNSLAYKINFKSDTSFENVNVTPTINTRVGIGGNVFSMELFIDAMSAMKTMASAYEKNLASIQTIMDEINALKDIEINTTNINELIERIDEIDKRTSGTPVDTSYFTELVSKIYDDYGKLVEKIISDNAISVDYQVNPSYLNSIINHTQQYNNQTNFDFTLDPETVIPLVKYTNCIRHTYDDGNPVPSLEFDKNIVIDYSNVKWETGQTFRIIFSKQILMNSNTIHISTVAKDGNVTVGNVSLFDITSDSFRGDIKNPIFDIVCTNANKMEFCVDKIR